MSGPWALLGIVLPALHDAAGFAVSSAFSSGGAVRHCLPNVAYRAQVAVRARLADACASAKAELRHTAPAPELQPRDVVESMMAAIHRSNWDRPRPYYGFEVALRFLAPTHQAQVAHADPAGFARYLRQPHKQGLLHWVDYKFEGDVIIVPRTQHPDEAYQMVSVLSDGDDDWFRVRYKLLRVPDLPDGSDEQWMVEAVFANEPDEPTDDEFMLSQPHDEQPAAARTPTVSPRAVVEKVMRGLRHMDEPYRLHGAAVATRYCAPSNRASELSPEAFAQYLLEPWYSILAEWDEIQFESDELSETERTEATAGNTAAEDVLVRRAGEKSWTLVTWQLSLHNGRWLIQSLDVSS